MTDILETVFVVTSEGFAAQQNGSELLSLDLKTILSLVDGICPVGQYIPFLLVFQPLSEKFQSLEKMGYLKSSGQISTQAMSAFKNSVIERQPLSRLPRIDSLDSESGFARLT